MASVRVTRGRRSVVWLLLGSIALTSCALQSPATIAPLEPAPAGTLEPAVVHRLYFGRAIPGGGTVTEAEWEAFVDEMVGPNFPEGFTVWRADGSWQEERTGRVVREPTFVLEIVLPNGTPQDSSVRLVAREYIRRFLQQAVLWVRDDDVLMSIESE